MPAVSEGTAVSTGHQGEQCFQLAQQVLKRPFYLHYPIHYKVISNADVICGGFTLLWWRGKGRGAHKSLDTEILCESLLGVAERGPSANCPLCLPLHRDKFQKEKLSATVICKDN